MKNIKLILLFLLSGWTIQAQTNTDAITGEWLTQSKDGSILIYKQANKYYGKIIGGNSEGRKDDKNPDEKLRSQPLIGKVILSNFVFDGKSKWEDGTIYDPNNGKTYSCVIKLKNNNEMEVRGYVGISLFGRTDVWTRIK
ncbi:MAG: DUF2147 domain-containing protein [Sphingobacteriales bacterium]|jgi:uncharacterized protein (DUF2147 family)|nr:MAG: DUF2147 domain-containing protein [Sphingobacteriales bacterium]